jgi:NhaP-type Na+/H+ or K+/H+ antiporter
LKLGIAVTVAMLGIAFAMGLNVHGFEHSRLYLYIATGLLCFGLYMAGYGIDLNEARRHWRIVAIAITAGVFLKYVLIAGVAFAITGDWRYSVLGMAVAQIDPLSVAALNNDRRMSPHTRTILNMWASFDDPITALATPALLGIVASIGKFKLASGADLRDTVFDLAPFVVLLLVSIVILAWRKLDRNIPAASKFDKLRAEIRDEITLHDSEGPKTAAAHTALLLATAFRNPAGSALFSLFCRPAWLGGRIGDLMTKTAIYSATFLLGILLSGGIDWTGGLVLGLATYASQIIIAWVVVGLSAWITPKSHAGRFSVRDTWHLALAQQNGVTAIVLALVLEPSITIAVANISFAIVVINLMQFAANWGFDNLVEPKFWAAESALRLTRSSSDTR